MPKAPTDLERARAALKSAGVKPEHNLTELGLARRFIDEHSEDVYFCTNIDAWFVWDGKRFKHDTSGGKVARRMIQTIQSVYLQAWSEPNEDKRRALVKFALACETERRITAAIKLAEKHREVAIDSVDDFDQDLLLLNVLNGVLDLRTGELRQHSREDLNSKLCPVRYDPNSPCPNFLRFIDEIFAEQRDLINFVSRLFGYCLTGDISEQKLAVLHGSGSNGKTTLLETIHAVLGDYGVHLPSETLLVRRHQGVPNDLALLPGARFVTATESDQGRQLSESTVKKLTGGDTIRARFLFKEWFSFRPRHKILLCTNYKPLISGTDFAIWRRIRLIPFEVQIPEKQQDLRLPEKLLSELQGILAWLVNGCLQWQEVGLGSAPQVDRATRAYRAEMDTVANFIDECLRNKPGSRVKASLMLSAYTSWNSKSATRMSAKELKAALQKHGIIWKRYAGGSFYLDVALEGL